MIIICRSCQRKYEFGMTLNDTSTITITPPGCSPPPHRSEVSSREQEW